MECTNAVTYNSSPGPGVRSLEIWNLGSRDSNIGYLDPGRRTPDLELQTQTSIMNRQYSKEEAKRIFALAAERQQAEAATEEGLSLSELEEAGLAAGIDPVYIRSAASDVLRPDRMMMDRKFLGLSVEFRESHIVPLRFDEMSWKKSIDIFSHVYSRPGRTIEVGTTKRWSSEASENQMPAHITGEVDEQGARFTIERKIWPLTLGFGLGSGINLLIALIFLIVGFSVPAASGLLLPAGILTLVGLLLGFGGVLGIEAFSRQEKRRFAQIFDHLERLADESDAMLNISPEERISAPRIEMPEDPESASLSTQQAPSKKRSRT